MSYRLKNSDFKPFLGVLEEKVRGLGAHVREGIVVHFGIFLSRESVPRGGEGRRKCDGVPGWEIRVIFGDLGV